jgi:thioredoxin reductase (NADPH)
MYDIIIIGAGPAGMTAAIYALRANKKVLIFEANTYGGQIVNAPKVENYPGIKEISGYDFATNLYNQVKDLGGEFIFDAVIRIDGNKVITNNGNYEAKKIILAIGAQNRKLNIPGESEYAGKGVSYCATCDGNFFKGKTVAIVGGGNTALEDAIYLSDLASKVYLIHRKDTFRGEAKYQDEINSKSNIELIMNTNVTKISGTDTVTNIELDNGNTLDIDGIFIAVGQQPNSMIFKNAVDIDEFGYIKTNDGVHTNNENIYVAGDARRKDLKQIITAESDGAIAAVTAIKEM